MCEVGCHPSMTEVQVKLHNEDIWHEFHEHTTEMIITKTGRRMFPYLRLEITGLEPDARYFILLEFNLSNNKRFKFNGVQWIALGNAEPQFSSSSRLYAHPDSPAVGRHWMSQSVLFNKVKLTNHTFDLNGNVSCVVLTSMHKYLPCVHVVMASDVLAVRWSPTATFAFKETEFIAVTAYQNERITKLKIDNNPFAKGFRETGQSRFKRKLSHIKDEVDKDEKSVPLPPPPPPPPPPPQPTLPQLQIMALQADDSGISSTGSVTPPVSDNEDILRPNSINNWLNERLQQKHHYNYFSHQNHHQPTLHHSSWMDLPLPPYPVIPPYCPTLWPYSPLFLPPMPPPHIYSHSLQLPLSYLPVKPNPSSEPCLIDLSIRKDN